MYLHFYPTFGSVISISHLHLTFYQTFRSVIFISHLYLSFSVIVFCHFIMSLSFCNIYCDLPTSHIMSFASVVFLSHSHLSSSLGILNLSFTILLTLHSVIPLCHYLVMCFCSLHLAFDMSICNFAYVIVFCHVLLSFFCRLPCHCSLSLSSVVLFCLVSAIFF